MPNVVGGFVYQLSVRVLVRRDRLPVYYRCGRCVPVATQRQVYDQRDESRVVVDRVFVGCV